MSVEKLDTVKLIKEKIPFTIHSNYVLQNVREGLPLAIWCYLTSLPDDWEVHRNQLMEHFNIGRDKLGTALKFLNENKLIEYVQGKLETGKFAISHIVVKSGVDFEVIHRNETALLKNRTTDLPLSGESAPTNTIINTNKINNKNKSSYSYKLENQKPAVDKPASAVSTPPVTRQDWKDANQKKHSWADGKKEAPIADVTKQSTSYDPAKHSPTERFDPNSPGYQAFLAANPYLKRRRERREAQEAEAAKLSTGTTVQSEIPSTSVINEQGATIDARGCQTNPPTVRGSNGVVEARRVHSYLEEAGMAGAN